MYLVQLFSSVDLWLVKLFHKIDGMHYWYLYQREMSFSLCDNWRSISFLGVVGKVFAKVIQQHLQAVVSIIQRLLYSLQI